MPFFDKSNANFCATFFPYVEHSLQPTIAILILFKIFLFPLIYKCIGGLYICFKFDGYSLSCILIISILFFRIKLKWIFASFLILKSAKSLAIVLVIKGILINSL